MVMLGRSVVGTSPKLTLMATHLGEAPSNILLQGFLEQITAHSQCADDKYRLLETKQGFSIRGLVRNLIFFC